MSTNIYKKLGIGDQAELRRFGILVVQHLPGVGQNFQDHPAFGCVWGLRIDTTFKGIMKTKRLPMMKGDQMIDHELSGEWLQSRPGESFSIRVPASATNGSYSVTEILSNPGDSTPVHLHENEDEHILVVEGTAAGPVRGQDVRSWENSNWGVPHSAEDCLGGIARATHSAHSFQV